MSIITPEERYETIVEALVNEPGVTPPQPGRGFGSSALKVKGKIFAMLVNDRLVVKLPKARVNALIDDGAGEAFDPRRDGRTMKEWISLASTSEETWLDLSREALEFVASIP